MEVCIDAFRKHIPLPRTIGVAEALIKPQVCIPPIIFISKCIANRNIRID